jgi:hypothetical protein
MRNTLLASWVVAMLLWLPLASIASNAPPRVDIRYLAQHESAFLGKVVSVHACWVWAHPHGSFIHPCDEKSDNGRYVLLIDYPDTGTDFLSDIYVDRLNTRTLQQVEADYVGTVTQETIQVPWGTSLKTRVVYVLMLQQVLHPRKVRY